MGSYTDDFLTMLRNQINIDQVIDRLMIDTRQGNNLRRFRCPLCDRFHTATNPKTNLGRCFECQKNFNPIDLVMAATRFDFIETVEFLKKHFLSRLTES
jgi:DNA primase